MVCTRCGCIPCNCDLSEPMGNAFLSGSSYLTWEEKHPKSNESRLLTDEEITGAIKYAWARHDELSDSEFWHHLYSSIAKAQDAKTASIKDKEVGDKCMGAWADGVNAGRDECQERVEKLIDYMGSNIAYWEDKLAQYDKPNDCPGWQELYKAFESK